MKIYGSLDIQGSINKVGSHGIDESDAGPNKVLCFNQSRGFYEFIEFTGIGISPEKIYYDSLVIGTTYPLTASLLNTMNRKYAPAVIENWSYYNKCFFEVIQVQSKILTDGLTFTTEQELIDYINTLPHGDTLFTNNIIVRIYDSVDVSIPCIDKMYGMNRLYAGLVGGGKSRSGTINCCSSMREDWDAGHYMLREMFVYQNAWASFLDVQSFSDDDGLFGCWVSRNSLKKFNLPKPSNLTIKSSHDRKAANTNYEAFQPIVQTDEYKLENPRVFTYTENSRGTIPPLFTIRDPFATGDLSSLNFQTFSRNYDSNVVFFRCTGPGTEDINYAIYIKPLGIDSVIINYVDLTKYEIECVMINRMRQKNMFRKVDEADIPSGMTSENKDTMMIHKLSWIFNPFDKGNVSGDRYTRSGLRSWDVSIRLRDKLTNKVGQLSNSKIVCDNTPYGFRFMID